MHVSKIAASAALVLAALGCGGSDNDSGPGPGPNPTPVPVNCPTNGPLTDLRRDCSEMTYLYSRGAVLTGILTDGETLVACVGQSADEVLCFGGPVRSATAFGLLVVRLNDSPFLPLASGSEGRTRDGARLLDLFIRLVTGESYDFTDFRFDEAVPVSSEAGALNEGLDADQALASPLKAALLNELSRQAEQGQGLDATQALTDPSLMPELLAELQRQAE